MVNGFHGGTAEPFVTDILLPVGKSIEIGLASRQVPIVAITQV